MANEIHMNFCIFNFEEDIEEISRLMGCSPTKAWLKGGKFNEAHPNLKATHSRWVLSSGHETSVGFEEQLSALLEKLEERKNEVSIVTGKYESGIVVASYFYETNPGFSISPAALKRLTNLGVSIDFDLYCLGEPGE